MSDERCCTCGSVIVREAPYYEVIHDRLVCDGCFARITRPLVTVEALEEFAARPEMVEIRNIQSHEFAGDGLFDMRCRGCGIGLGEEFDERYRSRCPNARASIPR